MGQQGRWRTEGGTTVSTRVGRAGLAAVLSAALLVVSPVAVTPPPARAASFAAFPGDFPDPFLLTHEGAHIAYSTQRGGTNVPVMVSWDLVDWYDLGDALPTLPGWAAPGRTWAPAVLPRDGYHVLYYSVHERASGRQCISSAVATSPQGPFADLFGGPLVCQLELGGSIDPSPFVDDDGTAYLLWKSEDNALWQRTSLWGQQLSADGLELIGPVVRLLDQDERWEAPSIEGPAMVAHGGTRYLFYGTGPWHTAAAGVGYAVCDGPLGPCTKGATAGPWMGSYGGAAGPSGPSFFVDSGGVLRMAYHAWTPGRVGYEAGGARALWVDPLRFEG